MIKIIQTMKKQLLFIMLITLTVVTTAYSQNYITQVKPAGSKFWGYANMKGELIIPAQYEKSYRFSEDGYATIYDTKARQYFFINTKGERLNTEIVSFKLRDGLGADMDGFKEGLIGVKVGEKWGFLNTSGKLAIPAKYDNVSEFSSGHAVAKMGSTYIVLDTQGKETMVQLGGILEVNDFNENLASFRAMDKNMGFLGTDGKVAITPQYESVGIFSNGLAWAKTSSGSVGYINPKGEWAIPPQYASAKNFDVSTGLARIKTTTGTWAYTNKTGELTYINDTETWNDFSDGLAEGKKTDRKGFYDSKGKWIIPPQFEGVRDFKNGYAAAKMGGKWGVIDKTGKWVIQPMFDGIKDMELVR